MLQSSGSRLVALIEDTGNGPRIHDVPGCYDAFLHQPVQWIQVEIGPHTQHNPFARSVEVHRTFYRLVADRRLRGDDSDLNPVGEDGREGFPSPPAWIQRNAASESGQVVLDRHLRHAVDVPRLHVVRERLQEVDVVHDLGAVRFVDTDIPDTEPVFHGVRLP